MGQVSAQSDQDRFLLVLDDPVTGLLPWLAWGLLPYVLDARVSAGIAFALAGGLLCVAWLRGEKPKPLEASDAVIFAVVLVVSLLASPGLTNWFEDHADLVSNTTLTILAVVSLVVGRPFTTPYTDARFPGLDRPLQQRLDRVSTGAWGLGLAVAAVVAWYGEYVLDEPNDFWTGWTLQLLPLLLAYHATLWFDRRAIAVQMGDVKPPSVWEPFRNVVVWLAPVGVIAILVNDAPLWFGEALFWSGLGLGVFAWGMVRRRTAAGAAHEVVFGPG